MSSPEPTIGKIIKRGKTRWQVDYGVGSEGKRKRQTHSTEAEAQAAIKSHAKAVRAIGDYLSNLHPDARARIVLVHKEVTQAGKTLSEIWEAYRTHQKEVNRQTVTSPMCYEAAVEEFKRRKLEAGKSDRYVNNTGDFLMKFGEGRQRQNIHEIQASDLEAWMSARAKENKWSQATKRTYQLLFSSLWTVAIAKGWCPFNIVDRLEPITIISAPVEIYSNDTTRHIMAAAMENETTQQIIAPLALGFFGCMRPEEVQSTKALAAGMTGKHLFGWQDIDLSHARITVRPEIAKTGDQRTIRLRPVAVEWLKFAKKLGNPLPPVNERRLVNQCCELIALKDWIRDGLRKSCATHLRAIYKNDYDVVKDLGNSVRVLLKHYAALNTPEDVSLGHWNITPNAVKKFRQSKAWKKVLREAAKVNSSEARQEPLASETARPGNSI